MLKNGPASSCKVVVLSFPDSECQNFTTIHHVLLPRTHQTPRFVGSDSVAPKMKHRKRKTMFLQAVGFEPTHLSIVELKSTALDHSAKLAATICQKQTVLIYSNIAQNPDMCNVTPFLVMVGRPTISWRDRFRCRSDLLLVMCCYH